MGLVENAFHHLENFKQTYLNSPLAHKQKLISSIFPEKIEFEYLELTKNIPSSKELLTYNGDYIYILYLYAVDFKSPYYAAKRYYISEFQSTLRKPQTSVKIVLGKQVFWLEIEVR